MKTRNFICVMCAVLPVGAHAETLQYTYDALGRLVRTQVAGGPSDGDASAAGYDPAGNRSAYVVGDNVAQPGPASAPTPAAGPVFSVSSGSAVAEGSNLTFTVTKSGATSTSFSVNFATGDGSATSDEDYTAKSGVLSFSAAETSKTVSVGTIDDDLPELAETVLLKLSSPSANASIGTAQAGGTISANDQNNQPPTAVADTGSMQVCATKTFNVVSNDTDADGDYPLTVTAASGPVLVSVVNGTSLKVTSSSSTGNKTFSYTVTDSRGASSSGVLNVTVSGGFCF